MNTRGSTWYRVPEMWLVLALLAGAVVGSLALVVTAYNHPDELRKTPQSIASPLPPSAPARPSDDATP